MESVLSDRSWLKSILETATNERIPFKCNHRGCAEGSPEGLITFIEEYRIQNGASREKEKVFRLRGSGKVSKNWIRLFGELAFGESLLNQPLGELGVFCVHAT